MIVLGDAGINSQDKADAHRFQLTYKSHFLFHDVDVLDVVDDGMGHAECSHYGDDVEAGGGVYVPVAHVVADGVAQVTALLPVNGLFGGGEFGVAAGLDFYEYDDLALLGDDVDVAVTRVPVAFQDDVALVAKIFYGHLLAPRASLRVLRNIVVTSLLAALALQQLFTLLISASYPSFLVGHVGQQPFQCQQNLCGLLDASFLYTCL